MSGKRQISETTRAAIVARYSAGGRTGEIAKEFLVDRGTVLDLVKEAGRPRDHTHTGRPRRDLQAFQGPVKALRIQGFSQQEIGDQLGCSQNTVSRVLRSLGMPTTNHCSGARHGSWKGGRVVGTEGYVALLIPVDDPICGSMRNSTGYVPEHRAVMARHLERPLDRCETVHHINGVRHDNRIENLQLMTGKHGAGVAARCACCGSTDIIYTALH